MYISILSVYKKKFITKLIKLYIKIHQFFQNKTWKFHLKKNNKSENILNNLSLLFFCFNKLGNWSLLVF